MCLHSLHVPAKFLKLSFACIICRHNFDLLDSILAALQIRSQGTIDLAMSSEFLWVLVCHKQSMVICVTGMNLKLLTILQLDPKR